MFIVAPYYQIIDSSRELTIVYVISFIINLCLLLISIPTYDVTGLNFNLLLCKRGLIFSTHTVPVFQSPNINKYLIDPAGHVATNPDLMILTAGGRRRDTGLSILSRSGAGPSSTRQMGKWPPSAAPSRPLQPTFSRPRTGSGPRHELQQVSERPGRKEKKDVTETCWCRHRYFATRAFRTGIRSRRI